MGNDINAVIQSILTLKNQGRNPQQLMQMLIQRNPNYQQTIQRLQNMANGRDMKDFVMQLAKQNGATQETLQAIRGLLNN